MLDLLRERRGTPPALAVGLTPRERDVLAGLVRGQSYKEIAGDLSIGIETMRTHIKALYLRNVAEAVSRAVRGGFVPGA